MQITANIPKDLSKIKTKVLFNLTLRQLICFVLAAAISFPIYYYLKDEIGENLATVLVVVISFPMFTLALYERDGFPAEKLLYFKIRHRFLVPGIRPYRSKNRYVEEKRRKKWEGEVRKLEEKADKERQRKGISLFKIWDKGLQAIKKIKETADHFGATQK